MEVIRFELSKPMAYAHNNAETQTEFIELKEPTGRVTHICCEIEAAIQSGLLKMSSILGEDVLEEAKKEIREVKQDEEKGVVPKMDADTVLSVMSGGGVDMKKVVVNFRELFKHVAFMGGEKAITTPRMDDMLHTDLRRMMGVYASNFILSLQ